MQSKKEKRGDVVILVIDVSSCWESIPDLAEKSGSGRRKVRKRKKSCCIAKQRGKESGIVKSSKP